MKVSRPWKENENGRRLSFKFGHQQSGIVFLVDQYFQCYWPIPLKTRHCRCGNYATLARESRRSVVGDDVETNFVIAPGGPLNERIQLWKGLPAAGAAQDNKAAAMGKNRHVSGKWLRWFVWRWDTSVSSGCLIWGQFCHLGVVRTPDNSLLWVVPSWKPVALLSVGWY